MPVVQPRHLLAVIFTVSLALTQHQPAAGTPPTHSGMAKAATVVASAAAPVMHHGSSRPYLWRLHTSDIEVRWSQPYGIANDRTGIEQLEIYVWSLHYSCCISLFLALSALLSDTND